MIPGIIAGGIRLADNIVIPPGDGVYPRWTNRMSRWDRRSYISMTTNATGGGMNIEAIINGEIGYDNQVYLSNGLTDAFITFDFGSGNRQYIDAYSIASFSNGGQTTGTWVLQASNDNSTYDDITGSMEWVFGALDSMEKVSRVAYLDNLDFYRYYRLVLVAGSTSAAPWLNEVFFHSYSEDGLDLRPAALAPDYANPLGTGDRRGIMRATLNGVGIAGGNPRDTIGLDNRFWWSGTSDPVTLEYDFDESCLITEFKWYQDNGSTHGQWVWQAFDTSTSGWIDLSDPFTLGGVVQTVTTLAGSSDYYSKYRLLKLSGNTSTSPYLQEIEFKIGYKADSE